MTIDTHKLGLLFLSGRAERQLTQSQVAQLANTSRSTVARLELGDATVRFLTAARIAAALGLDINQVAA